jgi:hypothetical protein
VSEPFSVAAPELVAALSALWASPPIRADLYAATPFRHLRDICEVRFPGRGSASTLNFALSRALAALGCPSLHAASDRAPMAPREAAQRLERAFRQQTVTRVHLCPLDLAGGFPRVTFGPAEAGRFSAAELAHWLEGAGGPRGRPHGLDLDRLARFRWLVVQEILPAALNIQARSLPELSLNFNQDFGRIEPHAKTRAAVVDDALFAFLMLPWEDHDSGHNPNWRVFGIPWIHTIDDDLFARPAARPDEGALTEFQQRYERGDGGFDEVVEPYVIHLDTAADAMVKALGGPAWSRLEAARAGPLFAPPIAHFFVRAFFSEPIDEFLAHVMTLEAALGTVEDFRAGTRIKFGKKDNPGPATRLAARLTALLGDRDAGKAYERLFDYRSQYVHGRAMGDIPSATRREARAIARRTASALVDLAVRSAAKAREDYLDDLLRTGIVSLRA